MSVIEEIAAERRRQVEDEGYEPVGDAVMNPNGELVDAAAAYCLVSTANAESKQHGRNRRRLARALWPWDDELFKPALRRRNLVRAAALLVAEIERLDRAEPPGPRPAPEAVTG